jgi:hypothetical protein
MRSPSQVKWAVYKAKYFSEGKSTSFKVALELVQSKGSLDVSLI